MDKPELSTPVTVAAKHSNGSAPALGMTKEQLARPVSYKALGNILDGLGLLDRIAKLERACGLAAAAPQPGVEAIAPVIARYIEQRLAPTEGLVHELNADALRYAGVYEQGRTYHRGQAVTLKGGLWLCLEAADSRPGSDGSWKLVVKSGQA